MSAHRRRARVHGRLRHLSPSHKQRGGYQADNHTREQPRLATHRHPRTSIQQRHQLHRHSLRHSHGLRLRNALQRLHVRTHRAHTFYRALCLCRHIRWVQIFYMARVPAQPQHQVVARRHVQRLAARPTRSARRRVDRHPCRLLSQQAATRSHTPLQLPLHRSLCLRFYQRRPKIYQTHRAELRTAVRRPPCLLQHQPQNRTAALAERHLHAHHPPPPSPPSARAPSRACAISTT